MQKKIGWGDIRPLVQVQIWTGFRLFQPVSSNGKKAENQSDWMK